MTWWQLPKFAASKSAFGSWNGCSAARPWRSRSSKRRSRGQPLSRGTGETIRFGIVFKLILTEKARSDGRTPLRPRHIRLHSGFLTGLDILDLEVTLVGDDGDRRDAEDLLGRFGSLGQQPHIEHL